MSATSTFLDELASIAGGPAHIRHGTDTLPTICGRRPLALLEPGSAEDVARVLALCSAAGVPVEPAGTGTWLTSGRAPAAAPVILSTRQLTGLTEYEPADLVVGVRAGTPMTELARLLAGHGQTLPLDPPALDGATVGATLSLAAAGPLRARHGTPRDLTLGIEVATGDGRLLRFGGRVVKNVAGYDAVRLLVGSRGVLGIVTSAWLLLRGQPQTDVTVVIRAVDLAEAAALALAVRAAGVGDALEIVWLSSEDRDAGGQAGWCVAIRLRGSEVSVHADRDRLRAVAGRSGQAGAGADFWNRLCLDEARATAYFRLAAPSGALASTLTAALYLGPPGEWQIAAHAADGIVRVWRLPAAGPLAGQGDAARLAARAAEVAADLATLGGTLNCPVLPAELQGLLEPYCSPSPKSLALMRGIRHAFDPAGILSPGRHALG